MCNLCIPFFIRHLWCYIFNRMKKKIPMNVINCNKKIISANFCRKSAGPHMANNSFWSRILIRLLYFVSIITISKVRNFEDFLRFGKLKSNIILHNPTQPSIERIKSSRISSSAYSQPKLWSIEV